MKVAQILASNRPSISFEVFPPKSSMPLEPVKSVVKELSTLKPSFVSVTYGAAGGNSSVNTAALADYVQNECSVTALAHLTCVMATRAGIALEAKKLRTLGVENVLALRGDIPQATDMRSPEHFLHAAELVAYLKRNFPQFCLGGACYPEVHPESAHLADDIVHLKEKVDAGLDFLTTQMFFENDIYFHFMSRLRDAEVNVPVIAGIMPVTNGKQIRRICELSGTRLPPRFRAIVDRFGDNPLAMMDAGVAYATEQIIDLFANGVNHVHVYTMNRPETAKRIMGNLRGIVS